MIFLQHQQIEHEIKLRLHFNKKSIFFIIFVRCIIIVTIYLGFDGSVIFIINNHILC